MSDTVKDKIDADFDKTWVREPNPDDMAHIEAETGLQGQWEDIIVNCPKCNSSDNVYLYVDNKTCYCLECTAEFDIREAIDLEDETLEASDIQPSVSFSDNDSLENREIQQRLAAELVSDDPAQVNEAIRILDLAKPDAKKVADGKTMADNQTKNYKPVGFQGGYNGNQGYSHYGYTQNTCFHRPQHIVAGEGWGIWAGKKYDVISHLNDYDVVLNLTFTSIKDKHIIPIPELAKWADHDNKFVEIQMDWADYGTIDLPLAFWQDLVNYIRDNKKKMIVFCQGGHGRTGTALACLMVVSLGYTPIEAINWVRKNYCVEAIETKGQEAYVLSMDPETELVFEETITKKEDTGPLFKQVGDKWEPVDEQPKTWKANLNI